MTERDYNILIGVLLATNVIFFIIVFMLYGEINLLKEKLARMTDTVQALDAKIYKIELVQEETFLSEKKIEKSK